MVEELEIISSLIINKKDKEYFIKLCDKFKNKNFDFLLNKFSFKKITKKFTCPFCTKRKERIEEGKMSAKGFKKIYYQRCVIHNNNCSCWFQHYRFFYRDHGLEDCDQNDDNFVFNVYVNIGENTSIKIATILIDGSVLIDYEDEFNEKNQIFDGYELTIHNKNETYDIFKKICFKDDELLIRKFFILFFRVNLSKIKLKKINEFLEKDIEKIDSENIHKIMKKEFI